MIHEGCLHENFNKYSIENYGKQCYLYINLRI